MVEEGFFVNSKFCHRFAMNRGSQDFILIMLIYDDK